MIHVASGDLWAGAEAQVFTLLKELGKRPRLSVTAVLLNHGELERRLRQTGVPVHVFDEQTRGSFQILCELRRLFKQLRPQVVHTHRQKENVLATLAAATLRCRFVRTQHGAPEHVIGPLQWRKRLARAINTLSGRASGAIAIAVADEVRELLSRAYGANRVITIPNGIDIEGIRAAQLPAPFRSASSAQFHVAFLGRLEPVKRVDLFLETAALLVADSEEGNSWAFHVFGDGSQKQRLESMAAGLELSRIVTFHGHDPAAYSYLGSIDAVLMCSDHEGLPMIVLEALAAGTPVVAHAVGGMRSVLANGSGGILVDAQLPAAFAEAISTLRDSDVTALVDEGQRRLESDFSSAANATAYENVYLSLCH